MVAVWGGWCFLIHLPPSPFLLPSVPGLSCIKDGRAPLFRPPVTTPTSLLPAPSLKVFHHTLALSPQSCPEEQS